MRTYVNRFSTWIEAGVWGRRWMFRATTGLDAFAIGIAVSRHPHFRFAVSIPFLLLEIMRCPS